MNLPTTATINTKRQCLSKGRLLVVGLALSVALVSVVGLPTNAHADSISRFSRTLRTSKNVKARVSAVVGLARLKSKRAFRPLVRALNDSNRSVRAIAVTALGHSNNRSALGPLRKMLNDPAPNVVQRARSSIARLEKLDRQSKPAKAVSRRGLASDERRLSRIRVDASESPKLVESPELFIAVKSTADKSRGKAQRHTRKRRAERVRSMIVTELIEDSSVTTKRSEATRLGLPAFAVDASITKLRRRVRGRYVEVECEVRLTVSNERGKMLSFLTSGAKVRVAKSTYKRKHLASMRRDALDGAVKKAHDDLLSFLYQKRS